VTEAQFRALIWHLRALIALMIIIAVILLINGGFPE